MKSLRYIILFTAIGLNISCEKEIDVDLPEHVAKLSIHCNLISGEVPEATVSHSIHSVNSRDDFKALPDAEVILFENGVPVDTLKHFDNTSDEYWYSFSLGVFKGDYIIQSGKSYKVQVNYKNYETAYGETTCPTNFIEISEIDVSGLKIDSMGSYMEDGVFDYYRTGKVSFKLTGPLNKGFHYYISVADENREIDAFELTSQDPLIATDGNNISEDGTIYPNDNLYISGSNGNLNTVLTIDINPQGAWDYEKDLTDGIELRLETQSEEYYQFIKKVEEYENSEGNPFTEMVFLPNNIKGGYGFVSGGAIQKKVSL